MIDDSKLKPFVCSWDPALDRDAFDHAKHFGDGLREGDRDYAALRFLPGLQPAVYWLRELDTRIVNRVVLTAPTTEERRERAFRASVVRVENIEIDGQVVRRFETRRVTDGDRNGLKLSEAFELFSEDEGNLFDPATQQEIGEVARRRAFLPRGIAPRYSLPRTSLETLAVTASLRAERAESTPAAGTSSSAPAASPPPTST